MKTHTKSVVSLVALVALALVLAGCLSYHPGRLPGTPEQATFAHIGDTWVHYVDVWPMAAPTGDSVAAEPSAVRGTVVMIHGFGATIAEWEGLIPVLAQAGYRVIALDLRGHGWSTRPDGDYSLAAQARLVLDLADHLGVGTFDVVGHSWGSAVALDAVRQAPGRVRRVVLYNGMFFDDQQPPLFAWSRLGGLGELIFGVFYSQRMDEKMAFAFYDPERFVTEEVVEGLEGLMDRPGTRAAALATIRAMDFSELEAFYGQIAQPVLLIWGRDDPITPVTWGERLANRLPRARLEVVPQCGHLPMVEVPLLTSNAVIRFLAGGDV